MITLITLRKLAVINHWAGEEETRRGRRVEDDDAQEMRARERMLEIILRPVLNN